MTTTQPLRNVTTTEMQRVSPRRTPPRWRQVARRVFRSVFARGDLGSLIMTWALMMVTALAVHAAGWAPGLGILATVSFLAVGFGFMLARSHYSELLALIMSSTYSIVVILFASAVVLIDHGSLGARANTLVTELTTWFEQAVSNTEPENDDKAFVVFMAVLFWFLGHNAAWHVFRVDRVWRVIVPAGLVLIMNQFYYQGERSLDLYLVAFVALSLLLLIRSHLEALESDWYFHRVSFPAHMRRTFFVSGTLLSLFVMVAAWTAPTGADNKSLDRFRELLAGETLDNLADLWNRLFSSLEGHGIATTNYYGGDRLQLGGAIQLGDQPVMTVKAPYGPRYYWQSTVYDSFDFRDWEWNHLRRIRAYTDSGGLEFNIGPTLPGARRELEQTFTMLIRATDLVHAAPQPVQVGLPVEAELDCITDLESRTCVNDNLPTDVAIIRARETLRSGDSYSVTSSVSVATADMLRSAGQDYPEWVRRLYLQGAEQVSPNVRNLASQIVISNGAQTPYDQARAIEQWLRVSIQYNESIPTPPRGSDYIEWFLFEQKQGYCNYYATAMVFMLRAQGIPARLAAGFAQGTWDAEHNVFLVRERDAHTWVEVFFPGYGWVEFEPTADEAPIDRQDDQPPQTILPTLTPIPTPTPLPTATPSPTPPVTDATPTIAPADMPMVLPSPTPSPQPTTTPIPPPDPTRVGSGDGPNWLRVILITLAVFALIIIAILLVLLFLIWYVEYRGLGGLSIVQRAYARMGIYSRWMGLHFDPAATPDERRRYLVTEIPEGEKPVTAITRAYIEDRYAAPVPAATSHAKETLVDEAWQEARRMFIRRKLARFFRRGS